MLNKKKRDLSVFLVLLLCLFAVADSYATKRYWVGTGSNKNWNSTGNWSATSGGASGVSVPASTDSAYFNGSGTGQCIINTAMNVRRLEIAAGYTDTIKQGTSIAVIIGTGGAVLSGGYFIGSNGGITDQGIFTLSGTNFKSTTGRLTIQGNFTVTSGTFTHNNGEVFFTGIFAVKASITLYDCRFYPLSGVGGTVTLDTAATLNVDNLLTVSGAALSSGKIHAKGNILQDGINTVSAAANTGTIVIDGSGNQTFTGSATASAGAVCNVEVNKTNTLYLKNYVVIYGKWKYVAGTVDMNTYTSYLCFNYGGSNSIEGTQTVKNLVLTQYSTLATTLTVKSGDTLTVSGSMSVYGSAGANNHVGIIKLLGDYNASSSNVLNTNGGSGTLIICGTGKQTINGNGTKLASGMCNVVINKPSDTLFLKNTITVNGNWTYQSGIVNSQKYSSTMVFAYNGLTKTISGKQSLYNVSMYGNNTLLIVIPATDTLTTTGQLTLEGDHLLTMSTGVMRAKGDVLINNSYYNGSAGSATILIDGSTDQLLQGYSVAGGGHYSCNIKINKSGGTLTLKDYINVGGNWTYIAGSIDAAANASTVVFCGSAGRTISGSALLYNITFHGNASNQSTISTGDTLTAANELKYSGTFPILLYGGAIKAKGDITAGNTSTSGTGNTVIHICGAYDQLFTGGTGGQSRMPGIKIDKPGGKLTLKNTITVMSNWYFIRGNLDAYTYSSSVWFGPGTRSIQGNHSLYDVQLYASGSASVNNINSGDSLTVTGELKLSGTSNATVNTGVINVKGDLTITNTSTGNAAGTGIFNICGTGSQTLTGSNISNGGQLSHVHVRKPQGTLYLALMTTIGAADWIYYSGNVDPGTSSTVAFFGNGNVSCRNGSATMPFYNFSVISGTRTLTGLLRAQGTINIAASRVLNGNGQRIQLGGNWNNSGSFTYAGSLLIFNGKGPQRIIKSSGTETFDSVYVNRGKGIIYLNSPVACSKFLGFNQGIIATTATNYISMPDNAVITAGSDSSYICGPVRKTGNDAFVFPLGDTLLATGAYHPLGITAPSNTTDSYSAQYFSTAQAYSNKLQTDSLESISDCEYWNLRRLAGTSTVIPSVGWNTNSCSIDNYEDLRAVYWNAADSTWKSMGRGPVYTEGSRGLVTAAFGISATLLPVTIAKFIAPDVYAEMKRELDGGFYKIRNGRLNFRYEEQYNDADGKLTFNIYDDFHRLKTSNTILPAASRPNVRYGDNRYTLNTLDPTFTASGYLPVYEYYTLEVINEKKEKRYLRFYNDFCIDLVLPGWVSPLPPCH